MTLCNIKLGLILQRLTALKIGKLVLTAVSVKLVLVSVSLSDLAIWRVTVNG